MEFYRYLKKNELSQFEKDSNTMSYSHLFYKDDAMLLCNNITIDLEFLELENGEDDAEIYQYYIIEWDVAERLKKWTDEVIYYHNKLDIFILGVCHYGTGWDHVPTNFKLIEDVNDSEYVKAYLQEEEEEENE